MLSMLRIPTPFCRAAPHWHCVWNPAAQRSFEILAFALLSVTGIWIGLWLAVQWLSPNWATIRPVLVTPTGLTHVAIEAILVTFASLDLPGGIFWGFAWILWWRVRPQLFS